MPFAPRASQNANSPQPARAGAAAPPSQAELLAPRECIQSPPQAGTLAIAEPPGDRLDRVQRTQGNQAALRMTGCAQGGRKLNRKCSCGQGGSGGQCPECAAQKDSVVHRSAIGRAPGLIPSAVHQVLRSPGHPIDAATRTSMEARFGYDFGAVRFHIDGAAAQSASAVNALAYTVGRHVVFGAGQYAPASGEGQRLIAHELAHVVQQGGGDDVSPQTISNPADASEQEADRAADAAMRAAPTPEFESSQRPAQCDTPGLMQVKARAGSGVVQRRIVLDPPDQAGFIFQQLDKLCPNQLAVSGSAITQKCSGTPANKSCGCACDAVGDPARVYTVHVGAARVNKATKTLWDGSKAEVPETSVMPRTWPFENPDVAVPNDASTVEFGFFDAKGKANWYQHWRILAHELCGHARLRQSYEGGPGKRPGHDVTIFTENEFAGEHSEPQRGYSWNPHQGEVFYNPIGDRSKIVFYQVDGLHYEAPDPA